MTKNLAVKNINKQKNGRFAMLKTNMVVCKIDKLRPGLENGEDIYCEGLESLQGLQSRIGLQ